MNFTKSILLMLLFCATSIAQESDDKKLTEKQEKLKAAREIIQEKKNELNATFSNLPLDSRIKYLKLRSEAGRLFNKKRTFEALLIIYKMQEIFKGDPSTINLLGAIHVEFRNFEYANTLFNQALKLAGEDPKILFNIAELEFCSNNWDECLKKLKYVGEQFGDAETNFTRLILFKQLLSHFGIAEQNVANADTRSKHEKIAFELVKKYDHTVDSPYHYYAQAALAYYNNNPKLGAKWLTSARKIYQRGGLSASWDDTMIEFGYIKSHYGKSYKEEIKSLNIE